MSWLCNLIGVCPEVWIGACEEGPKWLFGIQDYWLVFLIGAVVGAIFMVWRRKGAAR